MKYIVILLIAVIVTAISIPTEAQSFYTLKYRKEIGKKQFKKLSKTYYRKYKKRIKQRYNRHYTSVASARYA